MGNIGPSKHFRAQHSDSISEKPTVTLHSDLHLNSIRAGTTQSLGWVSKKDSLLLLRTKALKTSGVILAGFSMRREC